MVGGGLNGNPWGTFEYKWKENISDGMGKGRTDSLSDYLCLLCLRGSKT